MNLEDGKTIYVNLQKLMKKDSCDKSKKGLGSFLNPRMSQFITQDPTAILNSCKIHEEHILLDKKIGVGSYA